MCKGQLGIEHGSHFIVYSVCEYTIKKSWNDSKQTQQFKMEDVTFFKWDMNDQLCQLSRGGLAANVLLADSATLKWIIRRIVRGEFVYIMKPMEVHSYVWYMLLVTP